MTEAAAPSAWVLEAEDPRDVRRALRAVRGLEPDQAVPIGADAVCIEFDEPPSPSRRVERRLGHPVEVRLDCAVAHYPLGRGYVVLVVSRPEGTDGIDQVLDLHGVVYREIARPADPGEPARICVPRAAVPDLPALTAELGTSGLPLAAAYEVGACSRD